MAFQVSLDSKKNTPSKLLINGMFASAPKKSKAVPERLQSEPDASERAVELGGYPMPSEPGIVCLSSGCLERCLKCPLIACFDFLKHLLHEQQPSETHDSQYTVLSQTDTTPVFGGKVKLRASQANKSSFRL